MTEFERQVAEAMCAGHGSMLVRGSSVADVQACAECQKRAPRVAAAIMAATESAISAFYGAWEGSRAIPMRPLTDGLNAARPVALAALRGETR
jgi:hypothetical protein